MKRGKEDEKPMFPRLHVNDTEKGGPRAPPRNKMALYEQFSIPSQRFNPRLLPNSHSNSVSRPPSSSQANGHDRNHIFPVRSPSQTPTHRAESYVSRQSDGASSNTSLAQLEQRKKVDERDFGGHIHSRISQSNEKTQDGFDGKEFTPLSERNFCCSVAPQNDRNKDLKQFCSRHADTRKDVRNESEEHSQVSSSRQQAVMSIKHKSGGEMIDSQVTQAKAIPNEEDQDCSVPNISRLPQDDASLQRECVVGSQSNDIEQGIDSTRDMDNENALVPKGCFRATVNQTSTLEATNVCECDDTGTRSPIQKGNLDESGDFSKTSIVKSLSSLKVTPDDVVELIGQKRFWKARREIANQQRVFAFQVFELHRLIKVQQLIAASPDVLLEAGAFVGNFPLKGSSPKKLSLEVVVEPQQQNHKRKNDSEKPNRKPDCSAENPVEKRTNHTASPENQHQANGTIDNRMSPWCFNHSPGHQWLIPVMTSSEGLVYKPYPAAGFTGTMHGGYGGPFDQVPHCATFTNPSYGLPTSHQVVGVSPFIPSPTDAYFPPYGMPVMNQAASGSAVEQFNQFAAATATNGSHSQNGHASVEGANFNTHHSQNSTKLQLQRNGTVSHAKNFQVSKERELQGSTASSPSEKAQGITKARKIGGGSDAHSLSLHSVETRQKTQVIKVVPHNRKSATESAARIFQSIQEERKQYDLN